MKTTSQPYRQAYSIIEVLFVIGISGTLLVSLSTMLTTLLKQDRAARATICNAGTAGRLAEQFRADVHAASAFSPEKPNDGNNPQAPQWRFALPEQTSVVYIHTDKAVERLEQTQGKTVRRETYFLPAETAVSIEENSDVAGIDPTAKSRIITMTLIESPINRTTPPSPGVTSSGPKETPPSAISPGFNNPTPEPPSNNMAHRFRQILQIDAVLGRDRRFAATESEEDADE